MPRRHTFKGKKRPYSRKTYKVKRHSKKAAQFPKRRRFTKKGGRFFSARGSALTYTRNSGDVRRTGYCPSVYISHEEFVCDLVTPALPPGGGPSPFSFVNFQTTAAGVSQWITPGNAATIPPGGSFVTVGITPNSAIMFPWLGPLSSSWQTYRFKKLEFIFTTTSSDALNSTNTALGTVSMGVDYNVSLIGGPSNTTANPPVPSVAPYQYPNSKAAVQNLDGAVVGKPSRSFTLKVDCRHKNLPLTDFFVTPYGVDQRFASMGLLYICTSGFQAAGVNIGELRVRYTIKLSKPISPAAFAVGPAGALPGAPRYRAVYGPAYGGRANASMINSGISANENGILTDPNSNYWISSADATFGGPNTAGVSASSPLGTMLVGMNGTLRDSTGGVPPTFLYQSVAGSTGYDGVLIPPRDDGDLWSLLIALIYVGGALATVGPFAMEAPTITNGVLKQGNGCFQHYEEATAPQFQINPCSGVKQNNQDFLNGRMFVAGPAGAGPDLDVKNAGFSVQYLVQQTDPHQSLIIQLPILSALPSPNTSLPASGSQYPPNLVSLMMYEVDPTYDFAANNPANPGHPQILPVGGS